MTCEVCDREGCPLANAAREHSDLAGKWTADLDERARDTARMDELWDAMIEHRADCAAHAVNWRDEAIAGRAREAALKAEVERLTRETVLAFHAGAKEPTRQRDEHRAALNRIADGLNVVHEDAKIVAAVRAVCRDLAAARADAATCRRIASEAIDALDESLEYTGLVATLRARLTSPEPGAERAKEDP